MVISIECDIFTYRLLAWSDEGLAFVIGIDIGGSTTKIVGLDGENLTGFLAVKATDPITSVYGAFGRFMTEQHLPLEAVSQVMITGVGASHVLERIYGIRTGRVDEFRSIGAGGLFLTGLNRSVVVSMGTGTALVMADESGVRHLGGTGVGGGTLLGLSARMLGIHSFNDIVELAKAGNLSMVDLVIGDISRDVLHGLPSSTTASNFGKLNDLASRSDVALGIINLVCQTIGMVAVFAARECVVDDVVLTGYLTSAPQVMPIFSSLQTLFGIRFCTPEHAEFATAVGAALAHTDVGCFAEIGNYL